MCFSVTCEISWPSTSASSASFWISASAPRVMWMKPPGAANALTPSVSSTMNVHLSVGRLLADASTVPTSVTYLCTALSCTTPYLSRSFALMSAPICRSSASVNRQVLLRFLTLLQSLADLTELRRAP